jgi:hypothetical protein
MIKLSLHPFLLEYNINIQNLDLMATVSLKKQKQCWDN